MCVFNFQWNFWILITHIMDGKWAVVICLFYYFVHYFVHGHEYQLVTQYWTHITVQFFVIVFDPQASLKTQKVALLEVLRGAFLGALAIWFFMNFVSFWRSRFHSCCIDSSSISTILPFYHFLLIFFYRELNFMKVLINETFLAPSVEPNRQLNIKDYWHVSSIHFQNKDLVFLMYFYVYSQGVTVKLT